MANKILIVGGVAGGATTAARLRRLDEFAQIVLFERGEYISFANCGLPYHVGGVIESRDALVVETVENMHQKFNLDVRNFTEVTKIDPKKKVVEVLEVKTGKTYQESYDKLVLSTGSLPVKPRIPGIEEASNLFTLRNIPDMDQIIAYIHENKPKRAAVIGGGFIGIEMMENLHHLGIEVTLVEMAPQVMGMFDFEMAQLIHQTISNEGVELILNDGVKSFENKGKVIQLSSGKSIETDLIIFAIGVRPDNILAKEAGLTLSPKGSVSVNEHLQTSDANIYAIGDVVEVPNRVTNAMMMAALAGPANRQGRIVANHICGIDESYTGTLATSVAKIFEKNVGSTGINERTAAQMGLPYDVVHIHPYNHANYYPGSEAIALKVIYNPKTEEIYGAQAIGGDGVDKRIDVLATAIFAKVKVTDLKNIDFAYAPPFGSAKDPVNMVGYVAENRIKGLSTNTQASDIQKALADKGFVLDIRESQEVLISYIEGSKNIPLSELRNRLNELPKDKTIYVYCQVGTRGYNAERILKQNGFTVKNLDGGFKSYLSLFDNKGKEVKFTATEEKSETMPKLEKVEVKPVSKTVIVDACGLQCPGPIMKVYQTMENMNAGEVIEVKASDPGFYKDVQTWADKTGNQMLDISKEGKIITAHIQKGGANLKQGFNVTESQNGSTIVVFSQDLDKAIAAFIIASGAKSMGKDVSLFFTFWGLNILRRPRKVRVKKTFIEKMFGAMMPRGTEKLPISNMNMLGMGPKMIRSIMKKKNVDSLQTLMKNAMAMGVKITACAMSMDIMGIKPEELMDGIEIAGVATYLGDTASANHNLFI